jgi:hypothetical protein
MKKLFFIIILVYLFGCGSDQKSECAFIPDTESINIDFTFETLEDSLPAIKSKKDVVDFLGRYPAIRDYFFNRQGYPDDSVFINTLYQRYTHPAIDTLLLEVHQKFGDGSELRKEFLAAFKNIKYYYPEFVPPKVQTMISGLETDLIVSDSLVVVGLDYFLGEGASYKPNMYEYMLRRYNKDFVVPSVVLLYGIADGFNKTSLNDNTVLSDMIAYGKAYAFTKQMLPCTPDSILIGYSKNEIDGAVFNETKIWKKMIEDQVLFSTGHVIKQKYIAERPKTTEISPQCPGRIGMWVGWQIVNKYLEETNKKLPDLMREADPQKIFNESKYRPNN